MKPRPPRRAPDWYRALLDGLGEVGHVLEGQLDLPAGHLTLPQGTSRMIGTVAGRWSGTCPGAARAERFAETLGRAAELNRRVVAALEDAV